MSTEAADGQQTQDAAVTLLEWCRDRSATDPRVELIGAFFRMETLAGRAVAHAADFASRLDEFTNRPA